MQECNDEGNKSSSERCKAIEVEGHVEWLGATRFERLVSYLGCEKISIDKEKIENFKNTKDDIERLELLRRMNVVEAIQALNEAAHTEGAKSI